MPLPQAKDIFTINAHDGMTEAEFIDALDQIDAAVHRIIQVAITLGKHSNDYSFNGLTQAGTGTHVAQFWARREAMGLPFPQPPGAPGGGSNFDVN